MQRTSVVPVVIDRLVADVGATMVGALEAVKVAQTWPGPDATREMLFLGKTTWNDYAIACIKSGRKQRDETAEIEFEVWVLGPEGTTPSNPGDTRDRAFGILSAAENVLADDPLLGLGSGVHWVEIKPREAEPRELANGWAYRVAGTFALSARLV